MKSNISKKLRRQSGESIAETLVALLISTLALFMLATALGTAERVITRSEKKMQEYYQQNNAMVGGSSSGTDVMIKYIELVDKEDQFSKTAKVYKNASLSSKPVLMYVVD